MYGHPLASCMFLWARIAHRMQKLQELDSCSLIGEELCTYVDSCSLISGGQDSCSLIDGELDSCSLIGGELYSYQL